MDLSKYEIRSAFNGYHLNEEQKLYLEIHSARFKIILDYLKNFEGQDVLDIGPSYLSYLLYNKFGKRLTLLGFCASESIGGHLPSTEIFSKTNLIEQDLNFWEVKDLNKKYDVIVCAEVIEHLYSSPRTFFNNINQLLNHDGLFILQTPNAVSLKKRLIMLFGKNPYEIPRENLFNPGHYREYTAKELKSFGSTFNFVVEQIIYDEYFEYPSFTSKFYRSFKYFIPRYLRTGITIVFRKGNSF